MTPEEFKAEIEKLVHISEEILAEFKAAWIEEDDIDALISAFKGVKFSPENLIQQTTGHVSSSLTERLEKLSDIAKEKLIESCSFRVLYLLSKDNQ